jgi:hypothetical protein
VPDGLCPMCREDKKLCESHLLSRRIYPLCRTDEFEPVAVNAKVVRPTVKQTKAHLLCKGCEDNLSKNGERWTVPLLSQFGGPFPLYDRLVKQKPIETTESMWVYAAAENPEIDVPKLIHFAMGIFWKASVHPFGREDGKPRIELGEDSEALRLFLRGEAPLPEHIALAVAVECGPIRFPAMIDPFPGDNTEFKNFFFYAPGTLLQIYIGDKVRESPSAKYCINVNPQCPILLIPLAKDMRASMAKHSTGAYKTEKLLRTTAEIEARGLSVKLGD